MAQDVISVAEAPALAVSEPAHRTESGDQSATVASTTEIATVELIEVWRPSRRSDQRGPRRQQSAHRRRTRNSAVAPSRAADAGSRTGAEVAAMPSAGDTQPSPMTEVAALPKDHKDYARDHTNDHAKDHTQDHAERPRRHGRAIRRGQAEISEQLRSPRSGRPERRRGDARMELADRTGRSRTGERGDRPSRTDRPERDPALRAKYIKGRADASTRREQEPDPNSPFAKLAILKEQLEAGNKEPR
jgi:ATP-dependent RNA helicase SUPV3L1/SUV3